MQLPTAGLIVIRSRKLLLAFSKNKQCFYLPGGKIDLGEGPEEALCREIAEEMHVHLDPSELIYYTHVSAPAYGEVEGTIMEQECFITHKSIEPEASAEIEELRFFTLDEYLKEMNTAPGVVIVLEKLKADDLID